MQKKQFFIFGIIGILFVVVMVFVLMPSKAERQAKNPPGDATIATADPSPTAISRGISVLTRGSAQKSGRDINPASTDIGVSFAFADTSRDIIAYVPFGADPGSMQKVPATDFVLNGNKVVVLAEEYEIKKIFGKNHIAVYPDLENSEKVMYFPEKSLLDPPDAQKINSGCDLQTSEKIIQAIWLAGGIENSLFYDFSSITNFHIDYRLTGVATGNIAKITNPFDNSDLYLAEVFLYSAIKTTLYKTWIPIRSIIPTADDGTVELDEAQLRSFFDRPRIVYGSGWFDLDENKNPKLDCTKLSNDPLNFNRKTCEFGRLSDPDGEVLAKFFRMEIPSGDFWVYGAGLDIEEDTSNRFVDPARLLEGLTALCN